jgi:HEPN domain-containing protein
LTATSLAQSYLLKALVRLEVLELFLSRGAFSDVVREAQEAVELMLKAILRQVGVEPPKWHDVGELLVASEIRLPEHVRPHVWRLAAISSYTREQAAQALSDARFCAEIAREVIPLPR